MPGLHPAESRPARVRAAEARHPLRLCGASGDATGGLTNRCTSGTTIAAAMRQQIPAWIANSTSSGAHPPWMNPTVITTSQVHDGPDHQQQVGASRGDCPRPHCDDDQQHQPEPEPDIHEVEQHAEPLREALGHRPLRNDCQPPSSSNATAMVSTTSRTSLSTTRDMAPTLNGTTRGVRARTRATHRRHPDAEHPDQPREDREQRVAPAARREEAARLACRRTRPAPRPGSRPRSPRRRRRSSAARPRMRTSGRRPRPTPAPAARPPSTRTSACVPRSARGSRTGRAV